MGVCDGNAPLEELVTDQSLAILNRTVLVGKNAATNTYSNVELSPDNAIEIAFSGNSHASTYTFDPTHTATQSILTGVSTYTTLTVQLIGTGTIAGGALEFQGSLDGTNWINLSAYNMGTNTLVPSFGIGLATGTTIYQVSIAGFSYVQVVNNITISGSSTPQVVFSYSLGSLSFITAPAYNTVQDVADGPNQPGTASGYSTLVGGVFTSPYGSVNLSNGQQSALQLDTIGNLLVKDTSVTAVTDAGGTNLNTDLQMILGHAVIAAADGIQKVGISGHAGISLDAVLAATKPANVLQVGGNDGTNAYAIPLTSGGAAVLVSGGGGGTQYVDGTAESAGAFTGTAALSYNGTGVVALRSDASDNLFVALKSGTNTAVLGAMGTAPATSIYALPVMAGLTANVTGTPTALVADSSGDLLVRVTDGTHPATASFAAWGTAPTGTYVDAVNAELFVGANAVSGTAPVPTSPTTAANTKTNPFFNEITDGTNAMGAMANFGTSPTAVPALNVNASLFSGTTVLGTPNTFGATAPTGAALGVNASLFVGTALVSGTAPVPISATTAANTKTNPMFVALTDGTNVIAAAVSALGTAPTGTDVETVQTVTLPFTSGGLTTSSASGLTHTAVAIKATAGQVYGYFLDNTENTAATFFQFFNATATATNSTGVGTAVPLFSIGVPASGSANLTFPVGVAFSSAICIAATTTYGGGTAPSNTVSYTVWYA
jgi:hypothetical protein